MNKYQTALMRHPATGVPATALLLATLLIAAECPAAPLDRSIWTEWYSQSHTLAPLQTLQFPVVFDEIPVRSWKLIVDGGDDRCDLSVLRTVGEELLYYKTKESRHEVDIPWGRGEEIIVVITSRDNRGGITNEPEPRSAFVVQFLGPPRDPVPVVYSYQVNRALDAYAAGRRIQAEQFCEEALRRDPTDGVAKVLLAGFQRDRRNYDLAATLVDEALAGELTPDMRTLAEDMRAELVALRAPLPAPLRDGIIEAEDHLDHDRPGQALELADKLLGGDLELGPAAKSRLHLIRGRALAGLVRNFEAVDAYTNSLQLNRTRSGEAVIYYHMGRLYLAMGNLIQAQGAYAIALKYGLPGALDMQAREDLQGVEAVLKMQQR